MIIYESNYRNRLILWDKVFPELNQMSLIRVFVALVSSCTEEAIWYSNKDTIAAVAWRWQMSVSTVKYAIGQLNKLGFISNTSRGVYEINKEYLEW